MRNLVSTLAVLMLMVVWLVPPSANAHVQTKQDHVIELAMSAGVIDKDCCDSDEVDHQRMHCAMDCHFWAPLIASGDHNLESMASGALVQVVFKGTESTFFRPPISL